MLYFQLAGRLSAEEEEKYDSVSDTDRKSELKIFSQKQTVYGCVSVLQVLNVIRRLCNKEHANITCSRY